MILYSLNNVLFQTLIEVEWKLNSGRDKNPLTKYVIIT